MKTLLCVLILVALTACQDPLSNEELKCIFTLSVDGADEIVSSGCDLDSLQEIQRNVSKMCREARDHSLDISKTEEKSFE